jgi:hypothetical protein
MTKVPGELRPGASVVAWLALHPRTKFLTPQSVSTRTLTPMQTGNTPEPKAASTARTREGSALAQVARSLATPSLMILSTKEILNNGMPNAPRRIR